MKLVIGGAWQGKKDWVMAHWGVAEETMVDGAVWDGAGSDQMKAIDHFHLLVQRWMESGADPETETAAIVNNHPGIIIITDEIGSGIVPLDPLQRQYREIHGRICCRLAAQSDEVVRVFCGIGQRIK